MKICYLILAHNNFLHLNRLTEALNDKDVTFYIHIDKKVTETYSPVQVNVTIIPQRVDIHWGDYTMIEATLHLMKYAKQHVQDADYFILISGVDYPIRSKGFLNELLEQKKEYIDIAPLPVPYKPMERFEYYYFNYDRRTMKHYNPLFLLEVLAKKFKIKRKIPFPIYVGTQWFALTRKCVSYILDTVDKDKRYEKFFRHSLVPDEAFFQTIIGNSPFRDRTAFCLTYTDWQVPVPPANIEERHVELLKNKKEFINEYGKSQPYFARKFNDNSTAVIDMVERELWE